jgi:hypothetical protein
MNLSIFGSKKATLVVSAVIGILMGIEIALVKMESFLSLDILHLKAIPGIAKSLSSSEAVNILFLGNSLTREGIDGDIMKRKLIAKDRSTVNIGLVYPDDTSILEWFYILKYQFILKKSHPDYIIINFGNYQLADRYLDFEKIQRISSYVQKDDLLSVMTEEKLNIGQSFDLFLAKFWRTFANRQRIQNRILNILPHYRYTAGRINDMFVNHASTGSEKTNSGFNYLEKFIEMAKNNDIHIIFAAMPLPSKYNIDAEVLDLIKMNGMTFIDARNIPGITEKQYSDGYHLNREGAIIYSDFLSSQILCQDQLRKEKGSKSH